MHVISSLVQEFYQFMMDNLKSDSYKKNNLKALILFRHELSPDVTFYDIQKKEKILDFTGSSVIPASIIVFVHFGKPKMRR